MTGSSTIHRRSGHLASDRDWLAEFPPESPPKSRLLAGATTQPVIARGAPRSPARIPRVRSRTYRSMLLTMSAMALLTIAAAAAFVEVWMRGATPLPKSEWPVPPSLLSALPSTVPNPGLAAPLLEALPASAPALEAAPAATLRQAPAAAVHQAPSESTPAPVAPSAARVESRAVAAEVPAPPGDGEVSAILSVLDRYRLAFSSLNAGSVRAVWPAADVRALARDFAGIRRQTFAFDNCRIDAQGVQAEAVCTGRVSLVTRAGAQEPNIQSRRWTFTLVNDTGAWRIRSVNSQ